MKFEGTLEIRTNDDDAAIALAAWACQQRIVIALMCAAQEQRFVGQQKLAAPATSYLTGWAARGRISWVTGAAGRICPSRSRRILSKVFRTSVFKLGVYLNDESKIDFMTHPPLVLRTKSH